MLNYQALRAGDVLASLIHQQEAEFMPGSDRLPDPVM